MEQQFVETIKVQDGKAARLPYHQARMARTLCHFFPDVAVPSLEQALRGMPSAGCHKARVLYGVRGIEAVEYAPYARRAIRTLRLIEDNVIAYPYKSTDRSRLQALAARKEDCDEVVIVRHGLITDTSFSNIAILEHGRWVTPAQPLLAGIQRARLLDEGVLLEDDITPARMREAGAVALINAMLELGDIVVKPACISMAPILSQEKA